MPVQPVVLTDNCGNLTGIPLPLQMAREYYAYTTNILAFAAANYITYAPWDADEDRYLLWFALDLLSITTDESSFMFEDWRDHIIFTFTIGADSYSFVFQEGVLGKYETGYYIYSVRFALPQAFPVPAGTNLVLSLDNQTNCEIDAVRSNIYYVPVG